MSSEAIVDDPRSLCTTDDERGLYNDYLSTHMSTLSSNEPSKTSLDLIFVTSGVLL